MRGRSALHQPAGWDTVFATDFARCNALLTSRSPATSHSPQLQLQGGQFRFTGMEVVDRFGRTLDIHVTSRPPRVADSLTPGPLTVPGHTRDQLVELPPRLFQPARLRFDPAGDADDAVCGWIMATSPGKRLMCYAPGGSPLGSLTVEDQQVVWAPLSESPDIDTSHPYLRQFRERLIAQGPNAFIDMMSAIDRQVSWQKLDHRPLALVRVRLGLELNNTMAVPGQRSKHPAGDRWPVRLGGDGLVGFYSDGDFEALNTEKVLTTAKSGYLRPAGPESLMVGTNTALTLLMDPYAPICATTGILPQATLRLPASAISSALARIGSHEPAPAPTKPAQETDPAETFLRDV